MKSKKLTGRKYYEEPAHDDEQELNAVKNTIDDSEPTDYYSSNTDPNIVRETEVKSVSIPKFTYNAGWLKMKEKDLLADKIIDDTTIDSNVLDYMASVHVFVCDKVKRFAVFTEHPGKERNIPGGKLSQSETFAEGWKRELMEEHDALKDQWGTLADVVPSKFEGDTMAILTYVEENKCLAVSLIFLVDDLLELGFKVSNFWSSGDNTWCKERFDSFFKGHGKIVSWIDIAEMVYDFTSKEELLTVWEGWAENNDIIRRMTDAFATEEELIEPKSDEIEQGILV